MNWMQVPTYLPHLYPLFMRDSTLPNVKWHTVGVYLRIGIQSGFSVQKQWEIVLGGLGASIAVGVASHDDSLFPV